MNRRAAQVGIAAAIVLTLHLLGGRAEAQAEPVPIESYWVLITDIQEIVSQANPDPDELQSLADRLRAIETVRLPGGSTLPLDSTYLTGLLQEPDTGRLGVLLETILGYRAGWPQTAYSAADREALDTILAGRDFQWADPAPNPLADWYRRVQRWFLEQLSRLVPALDLTGPFLNGFLLALFGGVLLLLLAYVYRSTLRSVVREAALDPLAGIPRPLSTDEAFRRAQEAAATGDRRSGVRFLYLAAQFALEETGALRPDRSRTHRELLADLATRPTLANSMRAVVEVFERVWYGFRPIDEADYARTEEAVRSLRSSRE